MPPATLIQLGALLIALASLIWQQRKAFTESQKKEKRIETKLKIFYALSLTERDLSEPEIFTTLEQGNPLGETDKVEARKALYEMLSEETVRFTVDKKYKPRQRSARGEQ